MTTSDIQELIALAIVSDKATFIRNMIANGISVPAGISDDDLYTLANAAWTQKGLSVILNVINSVPLNRNLLNTAQQNAIIKKLSLQFNPASKCDFSHPLECVTGFTGYIGDLLGGHSTTNVAPPVQDTTSTSALPPWALIGTVVAGLILIGVFRKFTAVVVGVIVIVLGVVLYGLFAKDIKTIITGGGSTTQSHGGIASALLALLQFA